jgi:cation diffusion facilitator CzcD-associated flavoprotein CzcO
LAGRSSISDLPKTCIIGAGSSGIAAAKELHARGLPFDCIEKSDQIGGNWVFKNINGMSSAYRSLHINTSRDKMAYSDFPMPRDYPDFPHHAQIAKYFSDYVDHFGFRQRIEFRRTVTQASLGEDRLWRLKLDNGETRLYDALIVANGHHWDARWPDPPYPGRFDGVELHSHDYIDPSEPFDLYGKRVVIVGFGNSALDIACELGRKDVANSVYVSLRRGYWVFPRYLGGRVFDYDNPHPSVDPPWWWRLVPRSFMRRRLQRRLEQVVGRPEQHKLPKPDHEFLSTHPAISHDIYNRIGSGDVIPKPGIKRFEGRKVVFDDDSAVEADVVIYATGYRISFPFFDPAFISAPDNDIALWKRMMDPRYENLFFCALLQPLCATMPIAEQQAKLISAYLLGEYLLPSRVAMEAERIAMHSRVKAHYVATARHTIQVDCAEYAFDLRREIRSGRARADLLDRPRPIAARADALMRRSAAAE